jgi:hypothetical protein
MHSAIGTNARPACDPDFHYRLGIEPFIAGVRAVADTLS